MAISRMQHISIIATRDQLDPILSKVQQMEKIQVKDLEPNPDSEYDEASLYLETGSHQALIDQEDLTQTQGRLSAVNFAIKQLESYVPKESKIKQWRTEKPTYSFEELKQHDQDFPEGSVISQTQVILDRMKEIEDRIEKRQGQIDRYSKWKNLSFTPKSVEAFQHIKALMGTVPNIESNANINAIKNSDLIDHEVIYLNDHEYGLVIYYQPSQSEALQSLLQTANFSPFEYPYRTLPHEKIATWEKEIGQLKAEAKDLVSQMKDKQDLLKGLKVQSDWVKSIYDLQLAKTKLGKTKHLVAIEGWIEAEEAPGFIQTLTAQFDEDLLIQTDEIQAFQMDDVPIKLKNNALVKPFELITRMYALPKYNELDPTPFLMPFYFVFFGMMVADLGYGLLTFLVSLAAYLLFKFEEETKTVLRFGMILGLAISIWGLLYGSFFGFTLPFQPINPNEDVMLVLGLSVFFGLIHIFTALGLNIYLKLKEKAYVDAYAGGLAWILLLVGFILLGVGILDPSYGVLGQIGKWLAILNALGIVIASCIKAGGLGGLGWGLYDLYGVTGYIGDLVSYTRLMALGLSGGSIALAFNMIIQFLPGPARFTVGILLFVLLHALSLFLSMLSAYVHGARLIFVEFFAKFYSGGGKPFEPLKLSNQHIRIKE